MDGKMLECQHQEGDGQYFMGKCKHKYIYM